LQTGKNCQERGGAILILDVERLPDGKGASDGAKIVRIKTRISLGSEKPL
jgi:hypothetical protein